MVQAERRRAPKRSKHSQEPEETPAEDPEWVNISETNTPFGLVAPEMQAYFKEVNATLTNLLYSEDPDAGSEEAELLLQAALTEMDGNELSLATDPTCSLVLENMAGIMKEKALRVFFDRMSGSYTERSDIIESAIRDAVATHVLESALRGASEATLVRFYDMYIDGRVSKLGGHPCANFVVATVVRLLPLHSESFRKTIAELEQAGDHLVKNQDKKKRKEGDTFTTQGTDGFTKDKIAEMAVSHEKQLLASSYGRFFVRKLRLGLYRKSYGEWKEWAKGQSTPPAAAPAGPSNVFAFLRTRKLSKPSKHGDAQADQQLADILSAIP
ncbi:Nucleolar protein 9 [Malassezia brasiliensis]|uniref:Nucleolar protein 9 n=1 Tax=Malassezia brasiliensis TaxID=1821822 RepID=A0AAF0IM34_9BASI|nr:Nucleolar protein 9 [Malassezia brasiliensis]